MIFKRKNYDYEIEFGGCVDFSFWALPFSICWIRINCCSLKYEFNLLLRFFCFQISLTTWKWNKKVTDVENSIEELFDE